MPPSPRRDRLAIALIFFPLILLAADFLAFPNVFRNRDRAESFSTTDLFTHAFLPLGTFEGYQVGAAMDNLASPAALRFLSTTSNALAISHFVNGVHGGSAAGSLGRAVLGRLEEVSPLDHGALLQVLGGAEKRASGDVVELPLHIPRDHYREFPIDRLFVVMLDEDFRGHAAKEFPGIFAHILRALDHAGDSALVLPCLGHKWDDQDSVRFDDCFGAVFEKLPGTDRPRTIVFSLYREWPTFVVEQAVSSIKRMATRYRDGHGDLAPLARSDLRLTLLLTAVCLFACSLYVPITLKNFLILGVAFAGLLLGSAKMLAFFTEGWSWRWAAAAKAAVGLFLAVAFPVLASWNPKHLFSRD